MNSFAVNKGYAGQGPEQFRYIRKLRGFCSPLHCAASNGGARMVALLLRHGASLEQVGCDGESVVHAAAGSGCPQTMALL